MSQAYPCIVLKRPLTTLFCSLRPDLLRRPVEAEERTFLMDQRAVSGTLAELGLTALRSGDVMDVLFQDFPDKYEEFRRALDERKVLEVQKAQGESAVGDG